MIAFVLLFALAALVAVGTVAHGLNGLGSKARAAHTALANCPASRELRFQVSEVKVLRGSAQVYALPVRQAGRLVPQQPLRAAA